MEQYRYIKRGDKIKGFGFLRVPRSILKETGLSLEAKMLYALMLDRTDWALREGHTDPLNRAYIKYPIGAISQDLGISPNTARKCLRELQDAGLLIKQIDVGYCNIYYVLALADIIH